MSNSEFMQVIDETRKLLQDNIEWRERYRCYAEEISKNIANIGCVRSNFHEWLPLKVYLNITSAKKGRSSVSFELRYMGQTVAELKGNEDGKHKLSTKGYEKTNLDHFGCDICLPAADWTGKDAAKFRRFFKNRKGPRSADAKRKNEEHRLESLLLTEFSKARDKSVRHIKPVTIGGVRFPMHTPIKASNHKAIEYSSGGGIDILARTGTGGKATHLCVIELKDENTKREPPKDAMKQAIAYATFIRELLRSEAGAVWWKVFGLGGKVPEPLELYAACAMPSNENNDYSFGRAELNIKGDTIRLHYMYFSEEDGKIRIKPGDTTLEVI